MLLPDEFSVGPLADAAPLTLMLPRTKYERHFLIGGPADDPIAICFAEDYKFRAFHSAENEAHQGLLISNVRIEVDAASAVNASNYDVPLGAIVRRGTGLGIMAMLDGNSFRGYSAQLITLYSGLAEAREGCGVGFQRWNVTLGSGENRRILFEVDLTQPMDGAATRR